ncbi:pseudouridine-5'-phosphatase-like [Zophobas morio]|uniref:pseudouridine-5'-phosphatase-like n=1 Tax=Zophobas morio TaxID=2755281 RepID=UPI003082E45D
MAFKHVSHVIFDMDGLIIESESVYDKVFSEIALNHGTEYTKDTKLKMMGTPDPITAQIAIKEMQLPYNVDQFLEIYLPRAKELLKHPQLMPGAKRLIQHLYKHNIPIAIATSSSQEFLQIKTQDHQELISLFQHIVCGSTDPEVKNGKPAPDIFQVCASRFSDKPRPDQCLVFEDSPNGAMGAIAAGMQVVLVPDPDIPREARQPATLLLGSLEEFKPELFGLPAFERF